MFISGMVIFLKSYVISITEYLCIRIGFCISLYQGTQSFHKFQLGLLSIALYQKANPTQFVGLIFCTIRASDSSTCTFILLTFLIFCQLNIALHKWLLIVLFFYFFFIYQQSTIPLEIRSITIGSKIRTLSGEACILFKENVFNGFIVSDFCIGIATLCKICFLTFVTLHYYVSYSYTPRVPVCVIPIHQGFLCA